MPADAAAPVAGDVAAVLPTVGAAAVGWVRPSAACPPAAAGPFWLPAWLPAAPGFPAAAGAASDRAGALPGFGEADAVPAVAPPRARPPTAAPRCPAGLGGMPGDLLYQRRELAVALEAWRQRPDLLLGLAPLRQLDPAGEQRRRVADLAAAQVAGLEIRQRLAAAAARRPRQPAQAQRPGVPRRQRRRLLGMRDGRRGPALGEVEVGEQRVPGDALRLPGKPLLQLTPALARRQRGDLRLELAGEQRLEGGDGFQGGGGDRAERPLLESGADLGRQIGFPVGAEAVLDLAASARPSRVKQPASGSGSSSRPKHARRSRFAAAA